MGNLQRCLYFIFIGGNQLSASRRHDGRCLPNAIGVCACAGQPPHPSPHLENVSNSWGLWPKIWPCCVFWDVVSPPPPPLMSATEFNKVAKPAVRGGGGWRWRSKPLGDIRGNFSARSRRRRHGDTEILKRGLVRNSSRAPHLETESGISADEKLNPPAFFF